MHQIVILGGGESGVGAALLALKNGDQVCVSDAGKIADKFKRQLIERNIPFEENGHSEEVIAKATLVIKSPGIPEKAGVVQHFRKAGIPLISEVEYAFRSIGKSKVIAITGSNGKSTTTALIYHICKHAGENCALVGNIGYSFARQVAEDPKDLYVLEISSFQLDDIVSFRANVAVLTNITEDHLDRYSYKMENYVFSKFRVIENQQPEDVFVFNMDDEVTMQFFNPEKIKSNQAPISMRKELPQGAYLKDAKMYLKWKSEEMQMSVEDFAIKGKHNQFNSMAASMAATAIDIRKEKIREALQTFESLEHRMEPVATIKGVEFINDSKSTNINSTWFALESMKKSVILILGGVDKGNDYSLIEDMVREKVKAIVCLGTDNTKIHEAFKDITPLIVDTSSAEEAVQTAFQYANKGEIVLLSPACASFDLFENYEDRGRRFKSAVRNL